jgi:hypothetical protein
MLEYYTLAPTSNALGLTHSRENTRLVFRQTNRGSFDRFSINGAPPIFVDKVVQTCFPPTCLLK